MRSGRPRLKHVRASDAWPMMTECVPKGEDIAVCTCVFVCGFVFVQVCACCFSAGMYVICTSLSTSCMHAHTQSHTHKNTHTHTHANRHIDEVQLLVVCNGESFRCTAYIGQSPSTKPAFIHAGVKHNVLASTVGTIVHIDLCSFI